LGQRATIQFCGSFRTRTSFERRSVAPALRAVRSPEHCPNRPSFNRAQNRLRCFDRALEKRMQNRPSGFGNPRLQLGLSVACVFVSELLLKRGANEVAAPDDAASWIGINGLASPLVWWAILLIIASFISWLYVLRYIPLNVAYPLSRVVDILVPLGCWLFLGELISTLRWCGIALVIIGLALVAKPIARMEERL
jgi:multidrug transporter EmrE-like cation transporter